MVIELLIASWFGSGLGSLGSLGMAPPDDEETTGEAEPAADLSEAKRLFDEGLARYDAADYEGAIEVFTLALSEVRGQGVSDFDIRGLLLFNIGRAHVRAWEIDRDVEHLRQAQKIIRTFLEEANSKEYAGIIDAETLKSAEVQLAEIDRELAGPAPADEPEDEPESDQPSADVSPQAKRHRATGIGLTVSGVAVLGAGVGMLVWGTTYGPDAQAQVDGFTPQTMSVLAQGDDFIAAERRKGTAWMAGGGVAAALGVAGLAVGIQQLIKAKRTKAPSVSAGVGPQGVGVVVSGRF
jgi:hypothetical protein